MAEKKQKHAVYLEIDDEITAVYDKIKRVKLDDLLLIIPKRSIILQSLVNLKILKRKIEDLGKTCIIITNDQLGQRLASEAGFEVRSHLAVLKEKEEKQEFEITPRQFASDRRSAVSSGKPTKMPSQKFSITELIRKGKSSAFPIFSKIIEWVKKRKKKRYAMELVVKTPNKQALITLLIISVFLLFVIAYIALPGATIIVTPASARIEQPINVVIADFEKNQAELEAHTPQMIAGFAIQPPAVKRSFFYQATGKIFQGENAAGKITIVNESTFPWPLIAKTRFQTEDGIVFRIQQAVTVPRAKDTRAGTLEIEVIADPFDASGQIIGGRGNIPPTRFFLPGLKNPENRKKLYAISNAAMTGGVTRVIKSVTDEDIKAAKEKAKKEIIIAAKEELRAFLLKQNQERGTTLSLIDDMRVITTSEPKIIIVDENALRGKEIEQFEVIAQIEIEGIAFNQKELMNLLKNEMNLRKSPDKKITLMDEESVTYKIFEIDKKNGRVKLTAVIRGIEQYNIFPETETGDRLIKKIKDHIAGMDIDDAVLFMQNLPEIDKVEVKSWPFWAPTLPSVPDNIEFEIK